MSSFTNGNAVHNPSNATPSIAKLNSATATASTSNGVSTSPQSQPHDLPSYMSQAMQSCDRSAELSIEFPSRFFAQPLTPHMLSLHSRIRNKSTSRTDFVFYADQLLRHLIEFSVAQLSYSSCGVITPTGHSFSGCSLTQDLCAVSILRAGESMESALRSVVRGVSIGKILIQRDESQISKPARLYYSKLPSQISKCQVLLLDPMLATGNSVQLAIEQLLAVGVNEKDITYVNLISVPEGVKRILNQYKQMRLISGMVDEKLNSDKYIVPGVGQFETNQLFCAR